MTYQVTILRRAQKELGALPEPEFEGVCRAIRTLAENPRPSGWLKWSGREGWRIREGNYRVVYELDDDRRLVLVLHVGHRRDVYRC
jgi:mRNA interferase RelE/StbE